MPVHSSIVNTLHINYSFMIILNVLTSSYMLERMGVLSCGYILGLYVLETQPVGLIFVTPALCKWNIR